MTKTGFTPTQSGKSSGRNSRRCKFNSMRDSQGRNLSSRQGGTENTLDPEQLATKDDKLEAERVEYRRTGQ